MAWSSMVDMRRTREEKEEIIAPPEGFDPIDCVGDYPSGLCLCFDQEILEKLELDDDCEVGDMIDLRAFARVTSVSINAGENGRTCRIELVITNLAVENEATEMEDESYGEEMRERTG